MVLISLAINRIKNVFAAHVQSVNRYHEIHL